MWFVMNTATYRPTKERIDEPGSRVDPVYPRRSETARYLGCSIRTLDALKHDGELPYYRMGPRLIVFKIHDLEAFMQKRRIDVTHS